MPFADGKHLPSPFAAWRNMDAPYVRPDKLAFDIDWIGVKASQFSFARLQNASLGYTFPNSWFKGTPFHSVNLSVYGMNKGD